MISFAKQVHRFLMSQSLYAVLLSTGLALAIFVGRIILSNSTFVYRNLVWNLFLAWIPYLFAFFSAALHRLFPRQWWLLPIPGLVWLVFFPNAPYIVTDFLHLEQRPYVPLWYDILLLATFAWTGCFLAIASLRTMQELIRTYLGGFVSWLFVGMALSLSGLGIYLGRFSRWNSWDLLTSPKEILYEVARRFVNPFSNLHFFGFTVLFTAFLLVCYLTFISVRAPSDRDE